jgi:acyl-ACP thioesterase
LIRTSVLLRYTQDLAGVHSATRGFDRSWYADRGIVWLVRAAEVAVVAPIRVGDELVGTTVVVGFRRVWARRRTEFHDSAGTLVSWVHIDWVLLDDRGAPTRIPKEFDAVFAVPPATFGLARVDLGEVPSQPTRSNVTVRPQELDPMDHVNNAVYADWLDEAVLAAPEDEGGHLDLGQALSAPGWSSMATWTTIPPTPVPARCTGPHRARQDGLPRRGRGCAGVSAGASGSAVVDSPLSRRS